MDTKDNSAKAKRERARQATLNARSRFVKRLKYVRRQ